VLEDNRANNPRAEGGDSAYPIDGDRSKPPSVPYPGFGQAVCLLIAGMTLLTVGVSTLAIYAPGSERNPIVLGLVNLFVLGSLILFGWERTQAAMFDVYPLKPIRHTLLAPMALVIVGSSILASETDNVLRHLLGPPPASFDLSWLFLSGGSNLTGVFFLLALVAPITEELLFRGLILRGFLSRYSVVKAVTLSALLFALFHLNPWQITGAFIMGAILAWWCVQTRSLLPCLLGHAAYNLIPLVALYTLPPIPGFTDLTSEAHFHPLALDMLGLTLAVGGIVWLHRSFEYKGNSLAGLTLPNRV